MRRSVHRSWPLAVCAALLLGMWTACAWAGPVNVAGKVLGPDGKGVPGGLVSDGVAVTLSDAQGAFHLASQGGRVVSLSAPAGLVDSEHWWWPVEQASQLEAYLTAAHADLEPQVALLSDPHLMNAQFPTEKYPPPPGGYDLPLRVWSRVAEQVKAAHPALTIVAGDLCMDADEGSEAHAKGQMKLAAQAMDMLPTPARALPGNHDVRYHDGQGGSSVDYGLWHKHLGPVRHVYLFKGMAWIFMDNPAAAKAPAASPAPWGARPPRPWPG